MLLSIIPLLAVHLNFCLCFRNFIKTLSYRLQSADFESVKLTPFQISMTLNKPFEISVHVISKESLNVIETQTLG